MAKRTITKDGFTITIKRTEEEDPSLDFLTQDYSDVTPESERQEYLAQDKARLEAFNQGDWCMMYVGVKVQIETATNWATPPVVGRAYLHGIESDSEESYFAEVEAELIDEALADARKTYEALAIAFAAA